ncbi:MAG: pilus assembly protein [Persephonella sp.]|nr:MAG: pilus assembly protein [Persephonella sp.]
MVIVDANVVLRYLLEDDDKSFKKAKEFFEEVFSGKKVAYLLQSVIAEIVYVLKGIYKVERKEISDILIELLKRKNIKTEDKNIVINALKIYADKNLDFVDCLICAYKNNFEIFTFDKKLNKCIKEREI